MYTCVVPRRAHNTKHSQRHQKRGILCFYVMVLDAEELFDAAQDDVDRCFGTPKAVAAENLWLGQEKEGEES